MFRLPPMHSHSSCTDFQDELRILCTTSPKNDSHCRGASCVHARLLPTTPHNTSYSRHMSWNKSVNSEPWKPYNNKKNYVKGVLTGLACIDIRRQHDDESPSHPVAVFLGRRPLCIVHLVVPSLHLVQRPVFSTEEIWNIAAQGSIRMPVRNLYPVVLRHFVLTSNARLKEYGLPRRMHVLLLARPRTDQRLSLERSLRSYLVLCEKLDRTLRCLLTKHRSQRRLGPKTMDGFRSSFSPVRIYI